MANQNDDPMVSSTSETPDPDVVTGEAQASAVTNRMQRTLAVLWAPEDAMRGVKLNGGWLWPFLFFVVCAMIWAFLAGPYMAESQMEQVENQMQERVAAGEMTQEQADQAIEMSSQFQSGFAGKLMMLIGTVVTVLLINLVYSALYILIGNVIHNGNERFGTYWSMSWYIGVIGALGMLLMGVLIAITQDAQGGHLGLAILTRDDPTSALHQAAATISIFTVWEAIVAGIGLSLLGRMGRGIGIVWGIVVVLVLPFVVTYILTNTFGGFGG